MAKYLTNTEHDEMMKLRDALLTALTEAVKHRREREDVKDDLFGREYGWVKYERQVMLDEVNWHQAVNGRPDLRIEQVFGAEHSAEGHSDYAAKYPLRVAQIAFGVEWRS